MADNECTICQGALGREIVSAGACGHDSFHLDCLITWTCTVNQKSSNRCPICRGKINFAFATKQNPNYAEDIPMDENEQIQVADSEVPVLVVSLDGETSITDNRCLICSGRLGKEIASAGDCLHEAFHLECLIKWKTNCRQPNNTGICQICLGPLGRHIAVPGGCPHEFHLDCLTTWKLSTNQAGCKNCPVCRQAMLAQFIIKDNPKYAPAGVEINAQEEIRPPVAPYYKTCQICNRVFQNSSAKSQHVQAEHSTGTFDCNCGKSYGTQNSLTRHIRSKQGRPGNHARVC